ncbi:MAG: FAD:protein FMN transferase [Candidatus Omnitrophica bacterium]|nr:FAD:protein FMN transferase [Candidatus Omnitrophota bacterium]
MFSSFSTENKTGGILRRARYLMGCLVQMDVSCEDGQKGDEALEAAFTEIKRIEQQLSRFLPESEVSQMNAHAVEKPVRVSSEVFVLIQKAIIFSELTRGAFDVTSGGLTKMWQNAAKEGKIPDKEEIRCVLEATGSRFLQLDAFKETVTFTRPGLSMDFGAMGKGYAVDRAVQILKGHGINEALVTTGSTLYCLGDGSKSFGIVHPLKTDQFMTAVPVQNQALSTSAAYERFLRINGKKYGHILNPRTGIPVQGPLRSVSILSDSAMESDVLSTACYVLGPSKAAAVLAFFPQARALLALNHFWNKLRIQAF